MSLFLVIRKRGSCSRFTAASGATFLECSLEDLTGRSLILESIRNAHLGAVVLEDLHTRDLPCPVAAAIAAGARGHSCPVVSRWTAFAEDHIP